MRQRCLNPRNPAHFKYGGRGITICERWMTYANFLEDMGERPEGMTLDRIDNNGHYEPSNCRWASPMQQMCNRRVNRFIEYKGEKLHHSEWARRLDMTPQAFFKRVKKYGEAGAIERGPIDPQYKERQPRRNA